MSWDSKTTVTTFYAYQIKKMESDYNVDELSVYKLAQKICNTIDIQPR